MLLSTRSISEFEFFHQKAFCQYLSVNNEEAPASAGCLDMADSANVPHAGAPPVSGPPDSCLCQTRNQSPKRQNKIKWIIKHKHTLFIFNAAVLFKSMLTTWVQSAAYAPGEEQEVCLGLGRCAQRLNPSLQGARRERDCQEPGEKCCPPSKPSAWHKN